jgi:iron complex transport system ATP-binding protein
MLQVKELHIGYTGVIATAESLQLNPGDLVALVGRNGSGKSTLLQTLRGSLPILSGSVTIDEKEITHWSPQSLATKIAWLNAHFAGVSQLRVLDYVLLGRTPYLGVLGHQKESDLALALHALQRVGADHLRDKQTSALSDGERQLVGLARALAQDTPYIFLDEPTAFLDFYHRKQLFTLLKELATSEQKGILLSTHDLDLVIAFQLPLWLVPQDGIIRAHEPMQGREALEALLI